MGQHRDILEPRRLGDGIDVVQRRDKFERAARRGRCRAEPDRCHARSPGCARDGRIDAHRRDDRVDPHRDQEFEQGFLAEVRVERRACRASEHGEHRDRAFGTLGEDDCDARASSITRHRQRSRRGLELARKAGKRQRLAPWRENRGFRWVGPDRRGQQLAHCARRMSPFGSGCCRRYARVAPGIRSSRHGSAHRKLIATCYPANA